MAPGKKNKYSKKRHIEVLRKLASKMRNIRAMYIQQKYSEHGNPENKRNDNEIDEPIENDESIPRVLLNLDNMSLVDTNGQTIQRSLNSQKNILCHKSDENRDTPKQIKRKERGRSEKKKVSFVPPHKPKQKKVMKDRSEKENVVPLVPSHTPKKKHGKKKEILDKENNDLFVPRVPSFEDEQNFEAIQVKVQPLNDYSTCEELDDKEIRRTISRKRTCDERRNEDDSDISIKRVKPEQPNTNVCNRAEAEESVHIDADEPFEIAVENDDDEQYVNNPEGHRIIDIKKFMEDLQRISNHASLFSCGLSTLKLHSEKQTGLLSEFKVSCQMCGEKFGIKSSSNDINKNAVSGVMAAGCGHAQLKQFSAALDLPILSEYVYNKAHNQVCDEWELTAWDEMRKAGERERNAAIEEGRVNEDGVPMIDVELDGCWSKRSYKSNYSASSGAATIIGRRFGQVLFMSVKNKYCCICARTESKKNMAKPHTCYKNYSGPSTSMEANIIVEGFKQSLEMHKVIYARFIADGDSNTYAKILEARPYPNITVEKVNCKNHVLRNFCNKLQLLKTDTKYSTKERKIITNERIMRSRKYITDAMNLHKQKTEDTTTKIKSLHKDLNQSVYHGFGIHENCNKEICIRNPDNAQDTSFTSSTLWQRIRYHTAYVASHARSLIEVADSNTVESFNGVIAKFVGGKRINLSQRRSYQARCAGAVISFNAKKLLSTVKKHIYDRPPSKILAKFEQLKNLKRERNQKAKKRKRYHAPSKPDTNYGDQPDKPDMEPDTFELSKKTFLKSLEKTEEERRNIEKRTVLQSASGEWMELRRNLLTASNFGKVVKRIKTNSCQNIVKTMLYKPNIDHVASISHGKQNENTAIIQLSSMIKKNIEPCGLFIDENHPFLGATPDGIIPDTGTIIEVKCPVLPYKIGIDEAIKQGKMHFWKMDKRSGDIHINKKSDWFIQIQGQLHITKADKCILGVWYGDNKIKTETITRDDAFWYGTMEPKLISFYLDCLLPELVDPRHTRNRPIRDPDYVKIKPKKKQVETPTRANKHNSEKDNKSDNENETLVTDDNPETTNLIDFNQL